MFHKKSFKRGSGCGSVGGTITSNSRGPRFESCIGNTLYWTFTVNCIEKTKIKKKRPWMAILNKSFNNLTTHSSRYWLLLDWQAIAYPVRSFWSFLLKLPSFARFYFFLLGLIPSIALMGECLWGSHLYHLVIQLPLPNLSFFTLFFNEFDISQ